MDMVAARRKAELVRMGKGGAKAGQATKAIGISQFSGGKTMQANPENDLRTSQYTGADLETLRLVFDKRKSLVRKIRRVTTLMRQKMMKNATINGNWYKLFKSYDRDNSGNISFSELAYVVYKELEISKLEMSRKELKTVWGVVDVNGDGTVSVEEFASFMRRLEANKIDHVILETVDKLLVESRSPALPSPSKLKGASVLTRATSPPIGPGGRHQLAAMSTSLSGDVPVSTWLRQYRKVGGYSTFTGSQTFFMGRPPEDNDAISHVVPRLEYNFAARQLQRAEYGKYLSTGGARYPLMARKRAADRPFEEHGRPLFTPEALASATAHPSLGTAPIDGYRQDGHWSARLSMMPTHAMLAKQHMRLVDLKHKYKIKT